MAAMATNQEDTTATSELLQAQATVFHHVFWPVGTMSLKCAVELGIPDIIHNNHGHPMPLSKLVSSLRLPRSKTSNVRRIMRLLVQFGCFAIDRPQTTGGGGGEEAYLLTPMSRILVKDNPHSMSKFLLGSLDPTMLSPFQHLSAWLRGEEEGPEQPQPPTAFELCHGKSLWDLAGENPEFNKMFNDAMESQCRLGLDVMLKECKHVFQGLRSLADVGGGTGVAARDIAVAFPDIKCTVLDLPHVAAAVANMKNVEAVGGDMFQYIPPADAILLKHVLHNWNDEDCVKILKRCKEAIPCREDGGKVLVVDIVLNSRIKSSSSSSSSNNNNNSNLEMVRVGRLFDMLMMVYVGAMERDEGEWQKLFKEAGFSGFKINPLGVRSLIEIYP